MCVRVYIYICTHMYFLKERKRIEIIKQAAFMTPQALVPPAFCNSMEHVYTLASRKTCASYTSAGVANFFL